MFTQMNADPDNVGLWSALQEIIKQEKEYEAFVTQNVCNDARDSITLTGIWRLHNQVYPYTKTSWIGVVSIISRLIEIITYFCSYKKFEDAYVTTDPDTKDLAAFMLVSENIKEPLRFRVLALNGSQNLGDFLPRDVIYVLECGCHHITFTMNSITDFCSEYLETFKKFVACNMLWAWDVDMRHNERVDMVKSISTMNLEKFLLERRSLDDDLIVMSKSDRYEKMQEMNNNGV